MVAELSKRILGGPGGAERPFSPEELLALARGVDLDSLELGEHRRFHPECYARNVVLRNEHVELAVICWLPGQASAVHDHGNSNCLYLVVEGGMAEELFELDENGAPQRTVERGWGRGDITLSAPDDIHRITNRAETELVTVHVYSPPLGESMTLYTPIPRRNPDG